MNVKKQPQETAEQQTLSFDGTDNTTATPDLYRALHAVRQEVHNMPATAAIDVYGHTHRYTRLNDLVDFARPLLLKHRLLVLIYPVGAEALDCTVYHVDSGQQIEMVMPLLYEDRNHRAYASAVTYALRQFYMMLLQTATDQDDDGEAASPSFVPDSMKEKRANTTQVGKATVVTAKNAIDDSEQRKRAIGRLFKVVQATGADKDEPEVKAALRAVAGHVVGRDITSITQLGTAELYDVARYIETNGLVVKQPDQPEAADDHDPFADV